MSVVVAGCIFSSCQGVTEGDDARIAKDSAATAELNRVNALLASSRPVSKLDVDSLLALRERYPNSAFVRQLLQSVLITREDWSAAEKVISEIPESEKKTSDKLNLAKIYMKQGRFSEAADYLRSMSGETSSRVEITGLLGQAQFYDGKLDEAAATLESVFNDLIREKRAEELSILGTILLRKGDREKAISVLQKAVEVDPESIPANNAISRAYVAVGDEEKAESYRSKLRSISARTEALEKKKFRLVPLFYQLESAYAAKDFAKVIDLVRQIQPDADDQTKPTLYQYLAAAYRAQGREMEARNALAEAAKLTQK